MTGASRRVVWLSVVADVRGVASAQHAAAMKSADRNLSVNLHGQALLWDGHPPYRQAWITQRLVAVMHGDSGARDEAKLGAGSDPQVVMRKM